MSATRQPTAAVRLSRIADAAAIVPGRMLQGLFGTMGLVRPTAKPLHPSGTMHAATIERFGLTGAERVGVPWVDESGTSRVLVRFSRATGLPEPLPDIHGLAIRILDGGGEADLLLATTGLGPVTRFLLWPTRSARDSSYSTLMPYSTPQGPLLIAATPDRSNPGRLRLATASPRGPWTAFAELVLDTSKTLGSGDESISFDPILHQVDGLASYAWATRLREGAYRAARWSRTGRRGRRLR